MRLRFRAVSFLIAAFALSACGGGGATRSVPATDTSAVTPQTATMTDEQARVLESAAQKAAVADDQNDTVPILPLLTKQTTIGSTVDPLNGDQEPYGLEIVKVDAGLLERGDLVVCNFKNSDALGAHEGQGSTIITLHPQPGSTPKHFKQDGSLTGCAALAFGPTGNLWAAAFTANDISIFAPDSTRLATLAGTPFDGPFGVVFAPGGPGRSDAFYVSNVSRSMTSNSGSIVRVDRATHKAVVIATGFEINNGPGHHVPGDLLGPSGLQYDASRDRLFIVDGADNSLTVFNFASQIPPNGIIVKDNGQFGGVAARLAKRLFQGAPLNNPISSVLLANGHLVLGNTGLDATGTTPPNVLVEFNRSGSRVLATKNVDPGASGAIFGIVATGTTDDTKIYFGDDNSNTVQLVSE